jgi:hypothetical protein
MASPGKTDMGGTKRPFQVGGSYALAPAFAMEPGAG